MCGFWGGRRGGVQNFDPRIKGSGKYNQVAVEDKFIQDWHLVAFVY